MRREWTEVKESSPKSNLSSWHIQVSGRLNKALESALVREGYRTKSAFVRDAVRRRLDELGVSIEPGAER